MTGSRSAAKAKAGDLYVRAMASTERIVSGVRADQWTLPTPCTEWNVRDVVNHVVSENLWAGELFKGKTIAEVGSRFDGDLVGSDPIKAYKDSVKAAAAAVMAPGAMDAICHLSFGDFPGSEYASQLFEDLLVHGWDIAKGAGQDTRLDPALVAACYPLSQRYSKQAAGSGVFAPPLPVSPRANLQTKMLALLGRKA